jgi:hypothetical protein
MTSRQGFITATYEQLVQTFGEPFVDHDGYKIDVEWEVAPNVYIYNWKNGCNYLGSNGTPVEDITEYNEAVDFVNEAVDFVKDRLHDDNSYDLELTSG